MVTLQEIDAHAEIFEDRIHFLFAKARALKKVWKIRQLFRKVLTGYQLLLPYLVTPLLQYIKMSTKWVTAWLVKQKINPTAIKVKIEH